MRLVLPEVNLLRLTPSPLLLIEYAGRTCYKSEAKGNPEEFIRKLLKMGHESVIEHASMTLRVVCDRGVSHEFVRHRLFSFCQESTRYCNYSGEHVEFVVPSWLDLEPSTIVDTTQIEKISDPASTVWLSSCLMAEGAYNSLIEVRWTPQQARAILPNSLKTELIVTGNLRQWKHFFELRCSPKAHPCMYKVATMILAVAQESVPVIFDDIGG